MPKYLVLYRSSADATEQMASSSPEDAQKGMELWMNWFGKVGPALADGGSPLGKSQTLPAGADTGTPVAGYSVLEADTTDDAIKLLENHPHQHAPGAVIEVLEYLPMPGM